MTRAARERRLRSPTTRTVSRRRRSPPRRVRPAHVRRRARTAESVRDARRASPPVARRARRRPDANGDARTAARRCASAPSSARRMARSLAISPPTMSKSATLKQHRKTAGRDSRERRADHVLSRGRSNGVSLRVEPLPSTLMSRRNDLLSLLATRSAKRGTFTLASGRQSSLYIDARITTMSPDGLALIGPLGVEAIRGGGMERRRGWRAHDGRRSDRVRDQLRERVDAAARCARSPFGRSRRPTAPES